VITDKGVEIGNAAGDLLHNFLCYFRSNTLYELEVAVVIDAEVNSDA
jgi:hypothetical protein